MQMSLEHLIVAEVRESQERKKSTSNLTMVGVCQRSKEPVKNLPVPKTEKT
jgi:hypothetical protein